MHSAYRDVTLEDLLAHRSGLVGAMTRLEIWNGNLWRSTKSKADLRLEIATEALALPPESSPGIGFHYSNAGYVVAGAMAERAAGEPWDELMVHELFEPLSMNDSGFGAPGTVGELSQPWGHYEGRSRVVPVEPGLGGDSPPALGPAGTIHASLTDVGRYLSSHLLGARGRGWFLEPETFAALHRPRKGQDYALGWVVVASPLAGGLALTHAGSNLNWYSVAWVTPDLNIALSSWSPIRAARRDFGRSTKRLAPSCSTPARRSPASRGNIWRYSPTTTVASTSQRISGAYRAWTPSRVAEGGVIPSNNL